MIVRHTLTPQKAARQTRTAFTLLEVLVVVAIIVMLAGIGGYYLISRYEEAKVSRAKIDCKMIAEKVDMYKLANDHPPTTVDQLTVQQPNGGDPLVPQDKAKDPWGKPYQLDASGMVTRVFTVTPKNVTVSNLDTK